MAQTRRTSSQRDSGGARKSTAGRRESSPAPKKAASDGRRRRPAEVASGVARQLGELTGRAPEAVTGLERSEQGWRVYVEVVEVRRIPDTADVMALYEVDAGADGDVMGYRRVQRYARGRALEDNRAGS